MSVEELDGDSGPAARQRLVGSPPTVTAADDEVTALDEPDSGGSSDERSGRPLAERLQGLRGRVPAIAGSLVLVALALGVQLGREITSDRRDAQAEAAREGEVVLVTVARSSGTTAWEGKRGSAGTAKVDGGLDIVNAGSLPVTVTALTATAVGLLTRPMQSPVDLDAGAKGTFGLRATLDCATYGNPADVRYSATVRTRDGSERPVDLTVVQPADAQLFDKGLCEPPQEFISFSGDYLGVSPRREDGSVTLRFMLTPSYQDNQHREPIRLSSFEAPWADSAEFESADGTVTIPVEGAEIRVRVTVSTCHSSGDQAIDGYLQMTQAPVGGSTPQPGLANAPVGARFQRDVLALVAGVCGPDFGESPPPG